MVCVHLLRPRTLCVNGQCGELAAFVETCTVAGGWSLRKRMCALHAGELVVKGDAIEAHDAELEAPGGRW